MQVEIEVYLQSWLFSRRRAIARCSDTWWSVTINLLDKLLAHIAFSGFQEHSKEDCEGNGKGAQEGEESKEEGIRSGNALVLELSPLQWNNTNQYTTHELCFFLIVNEFRNYPLDLAKFTCIFLNCGSRLFGVSCCQPWTRRRPSWKTPVAPSRWSYPILSWR